jgi:hypothetical protein
MRQEFSEFIEFQSDKNSSVPSTGEILYETDLTNFRSTGQVSHQSVILPASALRSDSGQVKK